MIPQQIQAGAGPNLDQGERPIVTPAENQLKSRDQGSAALDFISLDSLRGHEPPDSLANKTGF